MHDKSGTAISFAILFGIVGYSFVYVSQNPVEIPKEPYLGIGGVEVTPAIAERMGLEEAKGILVVEVREGSPAENAGIRAGSRIEIVDGRRLPLGGDVLVGVDGIPVANEDNFHEATKNSQVGDVLRLTLIRGTSTIDIDVTLEERPLGAR